MDILFSYPRGGWRHPLRLKIQGLETVKIKAFHHTVKQNQTLWWDLSCGFTDTETKWSKLSARLFPSAHTDLADTRILNHQHRQENKTGQHCMTQHTRACYWNLVFSPLAPKNKCIRMRSAKAKEILQEYNKIQIQKTYWKREFLWSYQNLFPIGCEIHDFTEISESKKL